MTRIKVLVLCHANRFRSPLAKVVLQSFSHLDVMSSGFKEAGRPAAKSVRDAAEELGYSLVDHASSVVDKRDLEWADRILYMDGGNRARLMAALERARVREHHSSCLADYASPPRNRVPDLAFMKRSSPEFADTVELIVSACKRFAGAMR